MIEFHEDSTRTMRVVCRLAGECAQGGGDSAYWSLIGTNFFTHLINLGYVGEAVIRQRPYDHRADALIIIFKLAGATFDIDAGPSVVDRCFELLDLYSYHPAKNNLIEVRVISSNDQRKTAARLTRISRR